MTTLHRQDTENARAALLAGLLLTIAFSLAQCSPDRECRPALASAQDRPGRPRWHHVDALMLAQAGVHEGPWEPSGDVGAIWQTIEGSRREGETFAQAIRRRMPNLAAGTTPRSWVRGLPVGPILHDPDGWPYRVHASHWSARWEALYNRAVGYLRGSEAGPCEFTPTRWVGPVPGRSTLAALLSSGAWAEAGCRDTRNRFLVAIDVD